MKPDNDHNPSRQLSRTVVALALVFGGCAAGSRQHSTHPIADHITPGDRAVENNLGSVAERIGNKYAHKEYIAFTSIVDVHESFAQGWAIVPEHAIAPGAAFDVVMSARGDIDSRLRYGQEVVYEFQIAVRDTDEANVNPNVRYALKEYDHRRGVRMEEQRSDEPMRSMLLSHEALKPTEWCATGGTVTTFVGVDGKVAGRNRDDDESVCDQIERGTLMDRQRLPGYGEVDVIKWVYKEATGPRKGPAGQTLDPSPAIWWNILVDSDHDLVVGDEGYIEFPGRAPVLVRRKRFENITFPEHVDHRVFTDVPESARDYVVWKPGEPYPPGGEASESKRSSAAPPSVPKSSP